MDYHEFLKEKQKKINKDGFDVNENELSKHLYNFQKWTVKRALKHGNYAIFADTGMGKTLMQLEITRFIKGKTLLIAPLAVTGQTIKEAEKYNIDLKDVDVTNYEQIDNYPAEKYECIILDESSILKNFTGKIRTSLIEKYQNIKYKFAFSATPSPNDPMELGNHAEFLNIMKYNEMLAMFFIHDAGKTQKWRLKGHAVDKFYEFVSSWAVMYSHPNDIGFEKEGYDLPELIIKETQVKTKTPDGVLFGGLAVNATDYNKSLRESLPERINETVKIVETLNDDFIIIWTKQNEEARQIYNILTEKGYNCRNVQGSDSPEKKKKDLLGFADGEFKILITK